MIAFFSLVSYMFAAKQITGVSEYTAIAFHSSISFVILMFAFLFLRPEEGIMKLISSHSSGGKAFRNTFPFILIIIIISGWLFIQRGAIRLL
jgi:nitrate reductase gamma subunit